MPPRLAALFAATLTAATLSSCATVAPMAAAAADAPKRAVTGTYDFFQALFSSSKASVEAVELGRAAFCNSQGRESALTLFTSTAQLQDWEASRGVKLTPITGSLPQGLYAIVEVGERNTGGYAFVVSRQAARDSRTLYIKGTYLVPKTSGMATQAITSACSLVLLRTDANFDSAVLLDQANKVRAQWQPGQAPLPAAASAAPAPIAAPAVEAPAPPAAVPAETPVAAPPAAMEKLSPQAVPSELPVPPSAEALPIPSKTPSPLPPE